MDYLATKFSGGVYLYWPLKHRHRGEERQSSKVQLSPSECRKSERIGPAGYRVENGTRRNGREGNEDSPPAFQAFVNTEFPDRQYL